jgi:phenylacetate-coenzyme A ligase PaaK-like adenylate-forming protein
MNNPLDAWTARCIGLGDSPLTRAALDAYQLRALRESVAWAKRQSPFYRRHLAGVDESALRTLADLRRLPFTTADDLRRNDPPLLGVSQSAVSHVITLNALETSATSGPAKRLFFTEEEIGATLDFFAQGMRLPARDRVLILFPGNRAGSVGELLARALERLGATPIAHGWPADIGAATDVLRRERPDVVAGTPVALLALARHEALTRATQGGSMHVRSVLVSADHAAASLRAALSALWSCEVFEHYGMTEMGLGGGVDCAAHTAYHLREGELLVEVVDPFSGAAVGDGELGEVVFSTLRRRALPLVRYRTGDLSRLLPGGCACATPLRRLERITRRVDAAVVLPGSVDVTIAELDEALFALPGVADFSATLQRAHDAMPATLAVEISAAASTLDTGTLRVQAGEALLAVPQLATANRAGALGLRVSVSPHVGLLVRRGKRRIDVAWPSTAS